MWLRKKPFSDKDKRNDDDHNNDKNNNSSRPGNTELMSSGG